MEGTRQRRARRSGTFFCILFCGVQKSMATGGGATPRPCCWLTRYPGTRNSDYVPKGAQGSGDYFYLKPETLKNTDFFSRGYNLIKSDRSKPESSFGIVRSEPGIYVFAFDSIRLYLESGGQYIYSGLNKLFPKVSKKTFLDTDF